METSRQKIIAILCGIVLVTALWLIAHRVLPGTPKFNSDPLRELGRTLAEETAQTVHDHGRVVVVIDQAQQTPGQPDHDALEAFQKQLRQHSSITLTATEIVSPDPVDAIPDAGCSRFQFRAILDKYADTDAIVFLFSLPEWGFVEKVLPAQIAPRILVGDRTVVGTKTQYGGYFDHGIISVLIVRTGSAVTQSGETAPAGEAFKKSFQIITSQNYQSMPE